MLVWISCSAFPAFIMWCNVKSLRSVIFSMLWHVYKKLQGSRDQGQANRLLQVLSHKHCFPAAVRQPGKHKSWIWRGAGGSRAASKFSSVGLLLWILNKPPMGIVRQALMLLQGFQSHSFLFDLTAPAAWAMKIPPTSNLLSKGWKVLADKAGDWHWAWGCRGTGLIL